MAKVIQLFDYREAELPDRLFAIKIKKADIQKKIDDAAQRFLAIEPQTDSIQENDIVSVSLESDLPWLSSECERFRVGRKFFYPEIEGDITNHKLGDEWDCTIEGDTVKVKVLSVKRRVVPKMNDEFVKELQIEDVTTLEEYTNYVKELLVEEDKEKKQGALCTLVNRQLIEKSTFEMEDDEVDNLFNEMMNDFEEGTSSEEELDTLLTHLYGGKTPEERNAKMMKEVEKQIKITAIANAQCEKDDVTWTIDDYNAFVDASANARMTKEELLEDYPYEDYLTQQKVEYLQEKETEYFDDRFKVEVID